MSRKEEKKRNTTHPPDGESSRETRLRRLVKVDIICHNRSTIEAIVRNVSTNGLCAKSELQPVVGDLIDIRKEGFGKVKGVVRWIRDLEFGVEFEQPIDVDLFNFGSANRDGHFVQPIDNGHVWKGFAKVASSKRPGFGPRYSR